MKYIFEDLNRIKKYFKQHPTHSRKEACMNLRMKPQYVAIVLSLVNLIPTAQNLLQEGEINISQAVLMARLTKQKQEDALKHSHLPIIEFAKAIK